MWRFLLLTNYELNEFIKGDNPNLEIPITPPKIE
jgi:hypothetical protein